MSPVKIYFVEADGKVGHYMDSETAVREKLRTAMTWLRTQLLESGWRSCPDMEWAINHVLAEFELLEVGDTLIAWSVGRPWFVNEVVLCEEFNAPFGDNAAPMEEVVFALEHLAKAADCTMISLGTRANTRQRGLARLFERTGARLSTIELVKELP